MRDSVTKNLYCKSSNDYKFVEPKTKARVRQIVIDDDMLEQLSLWELVQQKIIKIDFVLSYNGTPTNKHSLQRAIEKLSQMANIHRMFMPYATLMLLYSSVLVKILLSLKSA